MVFFLCRNLVFPFVLIAIIQSVTESKLCFYCELDISFNNHTDCCTGLASVITPVVVALPQIGLRKNHYWKGPERRDTVGGGSPERETSLAEGTTIWRDGEGLPRAQGRGHSPPPRTLLGDLAASGRWTVAAAHLQCTCILIDRLTRCDPSFDSAFT